MKGKTKSNSSLYIDWYSLINVTKKRGGRMTSLQTHALRQHTDFNLAFSFLVNIKTFQGLG